MANSVDPDERRVLLRVLCVSTVCSSLSVRIKCTNGIKSYIL